MLSSIYLNDVASFDKNSTEIIDDLKKINFIYGSNGSGKTTISNFLSGIEPDKYQNCRANWTHTNPLKILVYNKQFREDNFGNGVIAGVFTLGKATKDELQIIKKKNSEFSELTDNIKRLNKTLHKKNEQLQIEKDNYDKDRWENIYLKYKDEFKEAFRGSIGSKKDFANKLKHYCDLGNSPQIGLTIEEIREKAKTIFGKKPSHIEPLSFPECDDILRYETDSIWQTVIVGKSDVDIAGLINHLGANDWVDKGRQYISGNKICPFCQQKTITDDFIKQLQSFFDESFTIKKTLVSSTKKEYEDSFTAQLSFLKTLLSNEIENEETNLDCTSLETLIKTLESQFSENQEHMKNKVEHVSNVYELNSTEVTWNTIKKCIEKANEKISTHNQIVSQFISETHSLKESIWLFVAAESKFFHNLYLQKVNKLQAAIDSITQQIKKKKEQEKEKKDEIIELNKNITSIQPTVDEINRLLVAFGFHNFSLVPSPEARNHYTIKYEDGSLAHKSLSEGEVTFITFLYFLQLVKGSHYESSISDDRIVVIDDPISSLDSNILFIVSTLIKALIKDVKENTSRTKQLIILTHNVYFHKEASFINGRTKKDNQTNFWILRKINKLSKIQPYGMDNPIESSYELLWREVQNWQNNSGITIQNTMRRIIENYFKILGKFGDDDLINKFDTQEERVICRSLLCWINDGSHCLPDDLFIQTPEDETQRFFDVFKGIFEHTDNIGHYNMMMRYSVNVEDQ